MSDVSRRRFLALAGSSAAVLAACGRSASRVAIGPTDAAVAKRERTLRSASATTRPFNVAATPMKLDLAGRVFDTWGYQADPIRATAGDVLAVELHNKLPKDTTIHWHGIALRNDMDGVHDLTQSPIKPNESFSYRFVAPDAGTYFFHPHVGLQLDRALYAPLIIDDPAEPGGYDAEFVLVLDDWLDTTPEAAFAKLARPMTGGGGMDHGGMNMGGDTTTGDTMDMPMGTSRLLGGHAGDVAYFTHLINGRPPQDRQTFEASAGQRVRLRIINAASDTAYRFAIGGHRLTVTHADGFPVVPTTVDAIVLGMGERYDAIVEVQAGAHPVVASAEGKDQIAAAVLRAGTGAAPPVDAQPAELTGRVLRYADLKPADDAKLAARKPDTTFTFDLTGSESSYEWGINGKSFDELDPFDVQQGERVRVVFRNKSSMWHPMHLHGHTFALDGTGTRKDTVIVRPKESVAVSFDADNPGQWMLHCHNTYHLEAGMAAKLAYVR